MNTETHQWSTAADLPEPRYKLSATVCGDCIYVLEGINKPFNHTKSAYTCSLRALLQSCNPSSLEAHHEETSSVDRDKVWSNLANLPATCSTCVCFHSQLLAIGGKDSRKLITAVYMYNLTSHSWEVVSNMSTGRCDCFAAVLPDDKLMVVGGCTDDFCSLSDSTELASML